MSKQQDKHTVLFNASAVQSEGGVQLLLPMLRAFLKTQPSSHHLLLYIHPNVAKRLESALKKLPKKEFKRLEVIPFTAGNGLKRLTWEQFTLPEIIKRKNVQTLFSYGNTGPVFAPCEHILYIQQSIPYSNFVPHANKLAWLKIKWAHRILMALAQWGADKVVIPTSWLLKPMLKDSLGSKAESDYIISPPGIPDDSVLNQEMMLTNKEENMLAFIQAEKKSSSDKRILFYPTFAAPYKHLPYLLQALNQLKTKHRHSFLAVITIDHDSPSYFPCKQDIFDTFAQTDLTDEDVLFCGTLSKQCVNQVYALTDVLTFPSLIETTGLPLLEAMSHEIPVVAVTATVPAFAEELCSDAGLYANPNNSNDFAEKLNDLFSDAAKFITLQTNAKKRAACFDWDTHVKDIFETPIY